MTTEVQLRGVNELVAKLEAISYETKYKGGRFALRKAAQLIRDKAKDGARALNDPATAEEIEKNIVERWSQKKFKATGDLMFRVGVLGGARSTSRDAERSARKRRRQGILSLEDQGEIEGAGSNNPGGDTFYWRFLEFGTERAAAKPFLRPALERNIQAATDVFIQTYDKTIDRALKRAARAGGLS